MPKSQYYTLNQTLFLSTVSELFIINNLCFLKYEMIRRTLLQDTGYNILFIQNNEKFYIASKCTARALILETNLCSFVCIYLSSERAINIGIIIIINVFDSSSNAHNFEICTTMYTYLQNFNLTRLKRLISNKSWPKN